MDIGGVGRGYWDGGVKYESEENGRLKEERGMYQCCDTNLNFSTATCSEDDCEYGPYKKNKVARQDPMSHRIIEKRRRDRMNNCLADLSRLIPTEYLKKGRGRIEKTEIIEMAIKHMKYLQQEHTGTPIEHSPIEHYRLGYQECMSEAMRFMVEVEGHFPREAICVRLLNHLQKHCESISRSPHVTPHSATSETDNSTIVHHEPVIQNGNNTNNNHIQIKICDYQARKSDTDTINGNNTNGYAMTPPPHIQNSESDYEKHSESNQVSYKYKTNIKLRFSQDVSSIEDAKKQKLTRRNSITSVENESPTHSSPHSSEPCTRASDSDHHTSETSSHLKLEPPRDILHYTPAVKTMDCAVRDDFSVPVFALHAKGGYYVPAAVDCKALAPFLRDHDPPDAPPAVHNVVLHPVTINVNYLPGVRHAEGKYAELGNWR